MKRIFLLVWFVAALSLQGAAQTVQTDGGSEKARVETFDIVWRTVKEKHFDPTFGGLDWDRVREQYAPRVSAVKSDRELYGLLQEMLGELKQSHFNIIPPEAVVEPGEASPKLGGVGVDIQLIDGLAVITRVEPGSAAARAGLRQGFVVKQVDQGHVTELIARFAKSAESEAMKRLYIARTIEGRINGAPGTTVKVAYLDERDQQREATLTREARKGEMSPAFGNFPPQYMEFESKRLANGMGYIRFNIFVMPLMEKIKSAIRSMNDTPGIIIDLRGNPGGVGGMSSGIAGVLETRQGSLGTMRMRTGHINFAVFPQKDPYTGPVAVLIDQGSASTSEVFSSGLQELGRAVIVGERSMGAALPSYFQKLPTGALFQYAIADFKTPGGVLIEGRGVIPDIAVKLDRASLLKGRDTQLDAAVAELQKRRAAQKSKAVN